MKAGLEFLIGVWIVNSLLITSLLMKAIRGMNVTINHHSDDES